MPRQSFSRADSLLHMHLKAYHRSIYPMAFTVSTCPPKLLGLSTEVLLSLERPLYGLTESGLYLYKIYQQDYAVHLQLIMEVHDILFMYSRHILSSRISDAALVELLWLQTDDTGKSGKKSFMKREPEAAKRAFRRKPAPYFATERRQHISALRSRMKVQLISCHNRYIPKNWNQSQILNNTCCSCEAECTWILHSVGKSHELVI